MIAALLAGCLAVVLAQLMHLQVLSASSLSRKADRQHHQTVTLPGERGNITDRNGVILAKNMDVPSLFADPSAVENPTRTAQTLARHMRVAPRVLELRLKNPRRHFSWLDRKMEPGMAEGIMKLDLPGIHMVPESRRFYPKGELMGHILGFSGLDNQGLAGIELSYDKTLSGKGIQLVLEKDALGRPLFPSDSNYRHPDHGADLTLTVDEVIQYNVERALDKAMQETRAASASVVVMDPRTGQVLAVAVRPEYDPNRVAAYDEGALRIRTITDPYEPGSTLKMFVAATALEAGVVRLTETIDCENGLLQMRGGALHDAHPHSLLTFAEVLSKSSNIGTYKVASRLGEEKLHDGLARFGFGARTGIDLPGESPGILLPTARWSGRSMASIAIGQEVGVTPMQLVAAASAIANGGILMRPYLVMRSTDGDKVTVTEPMAVRRVVSAETARKLREALIATTEDDGTAPLAAIHGFHVAGKTGTAQKADPHHRGYAHGKFVSSFVGMVPAEDPRLVILVVLDEPQGKYYGGSVAAPVFRDVAESTLSYLGIAPATERSLVITRNDL